MILEDRVAVVTGASRGIGKQIAIELGRLGASVVMAARTVQTRRRLPGTSGETVADIEATRADVLAVEADMGSAEHLERLVRTTTDRFGRIEILVDNAAGTAGRARGAPLVELIDRWASRSASAARASSRLAIGLLAIGLLAIQRSHTPGAKSSGVSRPSSASSKRRVVMTASEPRWDGTSALDHSVGRRSR